MAGGKEKRRKLNKKRKKRKTNKDRSTSSISRAGGDKSEG